MRSQFYISYFKKELEDHSSGLVCISRLTCMAGQGELTVFPKTEFWTAGLASVHFQFNHSQRTQGLLFEIYRLDLTFTLSLLLFFFKLRREISFWLNWIESEVKTVLDLRVLKLQTTKKPKLLILHTNCSSFNSHFNWRLWNIHIKETAVHKKTYWESVSVFNNIAVMGVWKITQSYFPSSSPWGKWVHSYWRQPSQKNNRSQWKSAFVLFTH